jgi:hypothetical protein
MMAHGARTAIRRAGTLISLHEIEPESADAVRMTSFSEKLEPSSAPHPTSVKKLHIFDSLP